MTSDLVSASDPATQPSFTLANRLRRLLWGVVYTLLFRPSPRPLHEWRSILLRAFGARVGRGCHVYPKVTVWAPWNLELADRVGIGDGAICYSMGTIKIGERAVISQGAHLCAGTHDYNDPTFRLMVRPIAIGSRAWICADAFVGPGVTIGDGAVLGARGVAMRNVPAWTVWAGNPAVRVKDRNRIDSAADPGAGPNSQ